MLPLLFSACIVHGQILHPTGQTPSFEVATIKVSQSDADGRVIGPRGNDLFVAKNVTLKDLLQFAYTTDSDRQIIGLSGWMTTKRFDVDAKVGDADAVAMLRLSPLQRMNQFRLMQQSFLANRFDLKVHFETRELPIYALVVAKGGPKMKPSGMNPAKPTETLQPASLRIIGPGNAAGVGVTTGMLAEILERQPEIGGGYERTVVDRTNLPGLYDWTLHWTSSNDAQHLESDWPSLFTALQEQLGLRLEPAKAQVEVVVIDHIELPSPN